MGEPVERRRILYQRRIDALHQHHLALGNGLADHPGGEKSRGVLHHNGLLAQQLGEVEGFGQGFIGGLVTGNDFHQGHSLRRRKEVHTDKILWPD